MAVVNKSIKTTAPAYHPSYFKMVSEAISTLKDRTGSSQPAIAKVIEEKYKSALPSNFKKMLSAQLKKLVKSEKLFKVKNSYKVSGSDKVKNSYKVSGSDKVKTVAKAVKEAKKKKAEKHPDKAETVETAAMKKVTAKKAVDKAMKTKRASLVKSPKPRGGSAGMMKMLSEIKSPLGLKKKNVATPAKKKRVASSKKTAANKKSK